MLRLVCFGDRHSVRKIGLFVFGLSARVFTPGVQRWHCDTRGHENLSQIIPKATLAVEMFSLEGLAKEGLLSDLLTQINIDLIQPIINPKTY